MIFGLNTLRAPIWVGVLTVFYQVFFTGLLSANDLQNKLTNADCRVIKKTASESGPVAEFSNAILWEVSKEGRQSSHIFGTIHVSDVEVSHLPEPVKSALDNSDIFVMEALLTPKETSTFRQMMFYTDASTLHDYVDDELFQRIAKILSGYHVSKETAVIMKPWAAFLIMSYPANNTLPLDLKLLGMAMRQGISTMGLETLAEQAAVFSEMALEKQLRLLLDTVCHYDSLAQGIEEMKELYLHRDLNGLLNASKQYLYADETMYKEINKKLITDRNKTMIERMQQVLQQGNAFIAIGALHLPGDDGVIAGLSRQGYKITAIY